MLSKGQEHSWCVSEVTSRVGTFVGSPAYQPFRVTQQANKNLEYVLVSMNF